MKTATLIKYRLKSWYKNNFLDKDQVVDYNFYVLGIAGAFGHPAYWFLWSYIDPQKYEDLKLRAIGFFVSVILLLFKFWPQHLKKHVKLYWFCAVCYNLSFCFTTLFILNDFSLSWSCGMMACIIFCAMLLPNPIILFLNFLIGTLGAITYCSITHPELIILNDHLLVTYVPLFGFAIFIGYAFSYCNTKGIAVKAKMTIIRSLAGSIAHEIRNPLNTINLIGNQISATLSEINKGNKKSNDALSGSQTQQLAALASKISRAIDGANNIINIILNDLGEKSINSSDLSYLSPSVIIPKIVENYGYKEENEKSKIILKLNSDNDFTFKVVPERFTFIIYNLLKNALYYLKDYPDSVVTIGVEQRAYEGENYNVIYVQDTGPGIPENIIPKLFGDFYTSGKKGGTGLGLAFCKRNMIAFGGDIICESELKKWTKFSLLFPILSEEELKQAKLDPVEAGKKKILIVDDEQVNLLIEESILEKNLNIICDIAKDGSEAVNMVRKNYYDHEEDNRIKPYEFVLMDLEMPVMDGFEAIREIRKLRHDIPIIAYSYLTDAKEKAIAAGADGYFVKPTKKELLSKIVAKWVGIKYDPLKNKSLDDLKIILKDKKVLLADDEGTNLLMLAKYIEKFGAVVEKVADGQDLVEKYKASFSGHPESYTCHPERSEGSNEIERDPSLTVAKSDCRAQDDSGSCAYDLIITDINMYKVNGDEATVEIRKYEKENNLKETPIIAFTGDSEVEKLHHFFNVGMSDYFVKGDDNEYLIRIMAFWINIEKTGTLINT
ncbi:MAG: response regulator [Rickettsiales bacterium]|nr:response regulator [Rickettsiales bacterium]